MITAVALAASSAAADAPPAGSDAPRMERVAVVEIDDVWIPPEAEHVELYVRALSEGRVPVASLGAKDFLLHEDGARIDPDDVQVGLLEQAKLGVACVLVVDTSPTMADTIDATKSAALAFLDRVGSYDQVAVVRFADDVQEIATFSSSPPELRRAIDSIEANLDPTPTRVYDAVHRAVEMLRRETDLPRRAIVIVFSDGSDGGSGHSLEEVVELARGGPGETRVLVYTLAYPTGFGDSGIDALRKISEGTTAESLLVEANVPLSEFYADVWSHVMQSYVVRLDTDLDGATHEIEVSVGDGKASRTARYPEVDTGALGMILMGSGVLLLAGAAFGGVWMLRPARLVFQSGPQEGEGVRLRRGVNRLGTHGESEVLVRHDTVSRRHAEIEIQGRKARVRDLESTNGTFVNDVRLEGAQELQLGDRIRIADVELLYQR
jgi:hypothetical protein